MYLVCNSGMRSGGRDFIPMGRRDPMPLPPSLGGNMRGMGNNSMRGGSSVGYDSMFSRRTPPRSGNGLGGRFRYLQKKFTF